jgi:hypothetical protein
VIINDPEIVSLPTTLNNEPSKVKLLSTVAFGALPFKVNNPLS